MRTKLKPGEKMILLTRRHWYPSLFFPMILSFFLVLIGIGLGSQRSVYYLIAVAGVLNAIYRINYRRCDIWMATNLRVIDEYGLFNHYTIESPLDNINNVSFSQTLWGRQMGYGNVMIQTAADRGATTYFGVENPDTLKDTITTMQEEYRKSAGREEVTALAALVNGRQPANNKASLADELEKTYKLKQKRIPTEDEFNNLKIKILNA
ncbi:MAG TPA: PH domain-containing protein [Hanamia sp.]|nr:PH domain-containing protein [Hanamia sp.]